MNPVEQGSSVYTDEEAPRQRTSWRLADFRRPRPVDPDRAVYEGQPRDEVLGRETRTRHVLAFGDVIAAVLAIGLTFASATGRAPDLAVFAFVPLIVAIHKVAGLYDRDELVLNRSTLDEVPLLLQVSGVFALLVAAGAAGSSEPTLAPYETLTLWLMVALLVTVTRVLSRAVVRRTFEPERCLLVADVDSLHHVRDKITRARANVVAAVPLVEGEEPPITDVDDMCELIAEHDVHRVVIAPASEDGGDTVSLVRCAKAAGVRVSVLPRVLEAVGSSVEFEQLEGMTVLGVRPLGLSRSSRAIKRGFDLVLGTIAFIAVAPIFLALIVAIRLDSPGPIFFRQVRIGRDGKPFRIWKFRSMEDGAEDRKAALIGLNEAGHGLFKLTDDPRITRVGRLLRRTSLDELPQILNVLTGEMSLVGPRPLIVDEDALVEGIYRARLHLTPGMTGPWQILSATRVPMEEMVVMDYLYVANWSLWVDVKLLLRTIPHVLARRGL